MTMPVQEVTDYAEAVLQAAGLEADRSAAITRRMVESELLGHRTHGLAWLATYVQRLENGTIAREGEVSVVSDHAAGFAWQAHRLPGAWVMDQAIAAMEAKLSPVVVATIANCSHIGALQAYLPAFTDRGLLVQIAATDPSVASVAPFGGIDAVLTSNPMAMGIPTDGDPILIDQSTSVVSNAAVRPYAASGQRLPGKWLLDEDGNETDDPHVIQPGRSGTILPVGGTVFGYKGFGFGLMVEALALGLSGHGRHTRPETFGQGICIISIDPDAFGGREALAAETSFLVRSVHASRPVPGADAVRLPGERAQASRRRQLRDGLEIDDATVTAMIDCGRRLSREPPKSWLHQGNDQ